VPFLRGRQQRLHKFVAMFQWERAYRQPIPIKSQQAVQLLRASVFVVPSGDNDHDLMRKTKTNDTITIRGRVRDIVLRTVIVIEPAVLVNQLAINSPCF
jgi:hypothetical protein